MYLELYLEDNMDLEFHYHITYLLAMGGGFNKDDAYKIAYSSQYIDDNQANILVKDDQNNIYKNIQTQSYLLLDKTSKEIYVPFHFVPKCTLSKSLRKDCIFNPMEVESNSQLARNSLKKALKLRDPYQIGISSHAFVDSWAHQNFTGYAEVYNNIGYSYMAKSIGHFDALHYPDSVSLIWKDSRLKDEKINNNVRFLEAAWYLLDIFSKANKIKPNAEIIKLIQDIFGTATENYFWNNTFLMPKRIRQYNKISKELFSCAIPKYSSTEWFKKIVKHSIKGFYWKNQAYKESEWYLFNEAAKRHRKFINYKIRCALGKGIGG
ncbi:hypothetical protein Cyrtocomes_01183 [Candidatus Cyrtobacter comes]|uniref:Uncharacterized protein n=1 Tax=Candidatus Cyrtobacter comes TaxID=675776 RepID=A0ABU5L9J3_9RICK|nr:DUF6765 family protein [Candidatus Cyrtobacter comes]MDZ5762788.1 hypothetical protein [Candidatus Cyrtobacter comes]